MPHLFIFCAPTNHFCHFFTRSCWRCNRAFSFTHLLLAGLWQIPSLKWTRRNLLAHVWALWCSRRSAPISIAVSERPIHFQPSFWWMQSGRQWMMAQALGYLAPVWETRMELLAPDYSLIQPWLDHLAADRNFLFVSFVSHSAFQISKYNWRNLLSQCTLSLVVPTSLKKQSELSFTSYPKIIFFVQESL